MVREFFYGGDRFRATVHGRPGKEEIFIVQVLEDDEEGAEISLDRMRGEFDLAVTQSGAPFAWSEGRVLARVHSGVQH